MGFKRLAVFAVAILPLAFGAMACSSGLGDAGGSTGTSTPVSVDITEKGEKITPVGQVVKVDVGQRITLVVTSDADDEIHVHSDPEHEFQVNSGDSEKDFSFSIDTPGTWEVESHVLEVTILKLQVS